MHLNGSQRWFHGSKTSSIQYKTKDCNMYLVLNVSFHSLTKIESFFFHLPNILTKRNDTVWCRRTKTRWVITPPTRLSVQRDPAAEWTMNIKTSSKSWLIENVTLNWLLFFFPHFSIWPELLCCKLQCPAVCVFTLWATCLTGGAVCVDCRLRGSDYFSKHRLRKCHM